MTAPLLEADAALLPLTFYDFTAPELAIDTGLLAQVPPEVGGPASGGGRRAGLSGAMSLPSGGGGGGGSAAGGGAVATDPGLYLLPASSDLSAGSLDTALEIDTTIRALGFHADGAGGGLGGISALRSGDSSIGSIAHDHQPGHASASSGNTDSHAYTQGHSGGVPPGGSPSARGSSDVATVPEPSILLLMGAGLTGLTMFERRRRIER